MVFQADHLLAWDYLGFQQRQADCPPFCVAACYPQMVQIAEKATEQLSCSIAIFSNSKMKPEKQMRESTDHIKGVAFLTGTSWGIVAIPSHGRSQRTLALISCEWTFLQGAQECSFQTFTLSFWGQDGPRYWSLELSAQMHHPFFQILKVQLTRSRSPVIAKLFTSARCVC